MPSLVPPLPRDFWATNRRLMKIGAGGDIRFTEEGRREFAAAFCRHGVMLETVATLADFRRVTRDVAAALGRQARSELERLGRTPGISSWERDAVRAALKTTPEPSPESPPPRADVIHLDHWRRRRHA